MDKNNLQKLANKLRIEILSMVYTANSGHIGGSFSSIDILVSLFFGNFFKSFPKDPKNTERDYFILSKGHISPAYYSILSELGYFSKDEQFSFRQINSMLQGHPTVKTPGVEIATGSLGQGLSIANGIAMGLKVDKKDNKVFTVLGDGEIQEGQIWEASMSASHYKLDNLVAILDKNGLQIDGEVEKIMNVGDVSAKFKSFGWEVIEIDGHNFDEIFGGLEKAISVKGKPTIIIAKTIKGKGVSFMENNPGWHGKGPNDEQFEEAKSELEKKI